ncbi:MAG: response regulator, partial [Desulfobacterales bacterium]|nr:response regulator [Desulfobacterales bacterium]
AGKKENNIIEIIFEVEDSGIGINEGDIERIFRPFEQIVAANKAEGGSGLGLTITREFALLMGGNVFVKSKPYIGSTFILNIYAEIGKIENIKTDRKVLAIKKGQILPKILVVDDKADNRKILSSFLISLGFIVKEALNGKEAIYEYKSWHPDLIFMDMKMPVMDGYESIKTIRFMPEGANIPIIAISASAFKEDLEKILAAGANDFIIKPFKKDDIFMIIGKFLNIEYDYEEQVNRENSYESEIDDIFEGLILLSDENLEKLKEAILTLDKKNCISCIENFRHIIGGTADDIIILIEKYQFDTIDNLINKIKSKRQKKL